MSKETTYAGMLGDWQRLLGPLEANSAELGHLEVPRGKLATLLSQAREINKEQAALTAGKQDASRRLKAIIAQGQRLANALRKMIVEHYGTGSEKLAEFGLQPFRGRIRRRPPEEPETPGPPSSPTPEAKGT